MNIKTSVQIIFYLLLFAELSLYYFGFTHPLFVKFIELEITIIFFLLLYFEYRQKSWRSIKFFYISTFGLFNLMKIIFNIFYKEDLTQILSIVPVKIRISSYFFALIAIKTFLMPLFINFKTKIASNSLKLNFNKDFFIIGCILILTAFPIVFYRGYLEVSQLSESSFTSLYMGGASSLNIPNWVRIGSIFFQLGFMFVVGSYPQKRVFLLFSLLFLIPQTPNLLIGLRNTFALSILTVFWLYINLYKSKISIRKLIVPIIALIIFFQLIAFQREGSKLDTNMMSVIPLFLTLQSTSMYVLALYIDVEEKLHPHNYPFILDPLIGWLSNSDGQSIEALESRSSLGHQLVYTLDPNTYLSGLSFGTTSIAELYEFGLVAIFIGSMIILYFMEWLESRIFYSRVLLVSSFFLFSYILISPRSTFLPSLYFILRYLIFAIIVLLSYIYFRKKINLS